ncbi:MAG: DUF1648 domain-containing protein [Actinomycetota bacterium]
MTAPARASRGRVIALSVGIPVVLLAGAGTLVLSWSARLPEPVASHWGLQGVNGTSSLAGLLGVWLVIGTLLTALLGGIALFGGQPAFTRRMAAAVSTWLAAFLGGMLIVTAWIQLDVADAYLARDFPLGAIGVVVLLSLLLGAGVAALMPADPVHADPGPVPADAARTALGADERAVWTATVRMRGTDEATAAAIVLVVAAVVLTGQVALLGFLLIPVLLIVLGRWRVTVDRTGLWARSLLGAPRTGVALDQVVRADVVPLHPLREFGGWGIRSDLKGRYGLVLRAGDAIAVQRAGGGVFVATVDGAADAVALLNGLADRARAT